MKKSVITGIAVVAVAGALTVTAGVGSAVNGKWFKNADIMTWFDCWGKGNEIVQPVDPDTPDVPDKPDEPIGNDTDNGGSVMENGEDNGIAVMSAKLPRSAYEANDISPQADSAYMVTATVEPSNADNKAVTWSLAWATESGWASGKNISDYIALNSTTANPVTVTCKQAFGVQAVLTCTSADNSELTAMCTVDYKQKIERVAANMAINGTTYELSATPTLPVSNKATLAVDLVKTVGSISENFTATVTARFTDECISWLESNYGNWGHTYEKKANIPVGENFSLSYLLDESNNDCFFVPKISGGVYGSSAGGMFFYQYLLPDFNSQTFAKMLFTVTVSDGSGNKTAYEYKAKLDTLTIAAVSVSVNNSGIVF